MLTNQEKVAVLKRIFREDIVEFSKFFYPHHCKLDTPNFHKELYELYTNWDKKRVAIAAPRGHGKSTVTDIIFLSWCVVNKKSAFILLISDTYSQAALFLDGLKSELESNERLIAVYGKLTSNSWSEGEIVTNGIMVKALGAGMKVRGLKYKENRPDLVLFDDLENDELVENKDRREKLERWMNAAVIPSMQKDGRMLVIGTILHYDSLLYKLLDPEKYLSFEKKVYRAINDTGALWPEHLSIVELDQIKQDYIRQGQGFLFYQEYQNDPISDENRKFRIEKFKYFEDKELLSKLLNYYITIDRAYSKEKSADFTGIVVNAVDQENNWFIVKAERFKGTEAELIDKIFDLKDYYKPIKIGIEQKAFAYTIEPALKDEMRKRDKFFMVEELKDLGKSKNIRIEGLVPRFEAGSIFLKRDQVDLIDELIKFPKALHDDLADCLSYQLGFTTAPSTSGARNKQRIPTGLVRQLRPNLNANA